MEFFEIITEMVRKQISKQQKLVECQSSGCDKNKGKTEEVSESSNDESEHPHDNDLDELEIAAGSEKNIQKIQEAVALKT